jgi:hypothetical protein
MGFNSAFKGLKKKVCKEAVNNCRQFCVIVLDFHFVGSHNLKVSFSPFPFIAIED